MSYATRLESVRTAIDEILTGGQRVVVDDGNGGRKEYAAADLDVLRKLEAEYARRAAREARGGGIRVRGGTFA